MDLAPGGMYRSDGECLLRHNLMIPSSTIFVHRFNSIDQSIGNEDTNFGSYLPTKIVVLLSKDKP